MTEKELVKPLKVSRQRPMSASQADARSDAKSVAVSRYSRASSAVSRIPDMAPFQLMNLANDIHQIRGKIVEVAVSALRDKLSSSQIQKILGNCGYRVQIGYLKALLKELGFDWNGVTCSLTHFLTRVKEYTGTKTLKRSESFQAPKSASLLLSKPRDNLGQIIEIIGEMIYASGQTLYQVWKQGASELAGFVSLLKQMIPSITDVEATQVFNKVAQFKQSLTYAQFESAFKIDVPVTGSMRSETQIIQKIREWMFNRQYNAESAFVRLIRASDRLAQRTMNKEDFTKAIIASRIGLLQPEIDFLFNIFGGQEVTEQAWLSRIYDDNQNPLQLIREVVEANQFSYDDVLFQMKLRQWDDALDFNKFEDSLRRLDPSFSDTQCKSLFSKLKDSDGKVDVQVLMSNITGSVQDTVDYKNHMFKQLYDVIFKNGNQEKFQKDLELDDKSSNGKISPQDMMACLKKISGSKFTDESIQKFVRQLNKDSLFQISYSDFMEQLMAIGNKDHNPFRSVLQRLAYFIESNKVTVSNLLARLSDDDVSIEKFAEFLKQKVDKRADLAKLQEFALMMDIDKDGYISSEDLKTCLRNVNTTSFFKDTQAFTAPQFNSVHKFYANSQENLNLKLDDDKFIEVCNQIRLGLKKAGLNTQKLFNQIDKQGHGLINVGQFISGISSFMQVATSILEKIFSAMDYNQIGMIDFVKFNHVIHVETRSQIPRPGKNVDDSFDWQESIIKRIKAWIVDSKLNAVEAYRMFDFDFDGLVSKADMKKALVELIKVRPETISDTGLDRLFRLLSFFKTPHIQVSDFERLLNDVNPYSAASTGASSSNFSKSAGGGFSTVSTQDWKFAAIQQIGLSISSKFSCIEESFVEASNGAEGVTLSNFSKFLTQHNCLSGFNMTEQLIQKLFAELDPHKKTLISLKDWISCFAVFNKNDQLIIELKNFMQVQFNSCGSAFAFFQTMANSAGQIDLESFSKSVKSMLASRRPTNEQIQFLFQHIAGEKQKFGYDDFGKEFGSLHFSGKQVIQKPNSISKRSGTTSLTSKWETDVLDKLTRLIKQSGKSLDNVFNQIDTDKSGWISSQEFYNAMKLVSIDLTDMEIKKIMERVDANHDGMISYEEFSAKFRDQPAFDQRMKERANNRMALLKQQMILFMVSPTEAYKMFDSSKEGSLSFTDFERLIREISKLSKEEAPNYSVVKDLFDAIDTKKDGTLDINEWSNVFGSVKTEQNSRLVVKATPMAQWESTHEAQKIATAIARNRKGLIENFKKYSSHSDHNGQAKYVTFEQAKKALDTMLYQNFSYPISDEKIACLLQVGQVVSKLGKFPDIKIYDFMHILNVYRDRHQGPQFS